MKSGMGIGKVGSGGTEIFLHVPLRVEKLRADEPVVPEMHQVGMRV
jgi:hypothetical protein